MNSKTSNRVPRSESAFSSFSLETSSLPPPLSKFRSFSSSLFQLSSSRTFKPRTLPCISRKFTLAVILSSHSNLLSSSDCSPFFPFFSTSVPWLYTSTSFPPLPPLLPSPHLLISQIRQIRLSSPLPNQTRPDPNPFSSRP